MNSILPHEFFIYASNFSLKSMLKGVARLAFDIFNSADSDFKQFAGCRNYTINDGKRSHTNRTLLVQTWIIDLIYDLICLKNTGNSIITNSEMLRLISLYNDYCNHRNSSKLNKKSDFLLYLYGFLGEQKQFQDISLLFDSFNREKYILDVVSKKEHSKNIYGIDVKQEFMNKTGFSTDAYSSLILLIWIYFSNCQPFIKNTDIKIEFTHPIISSDNLIKIIEKYSISIDEIRSTNLKRQIFYSKPIIKIDDEYISANPFLLLCLFVNSNYWIMRDLYKEKRKDNQRFVNAFGAFFEIYVEEVLENCLHESEFEKIPEEKEKRADWYLKLGDYNFLIEQKSSLSMLGIKQNQPDIEMMKKHILKNWGEAVRQLDSTQAAMGLNNPIKIILLYEDYYKSECLDELFKLDHNLKNDRKYWLVTISEFEMLMMTYKENPDLFAEIISEKDKAEMEKSQSGRDPIQFLSKYGVVQNKYLEEFGVNKQFDYIEDLYK